MTKSRPWFTPDSSESPSLCRWGCLSHKAACCSDCLSLKILPLELFSLKLTFVCENMKLIPSWWSDVLQASMKVWATTLRQESTMLAFPRSNTKFGFLIRFTQNLHKLGQRRPKCFAGLCFIFESRTRTRTLILPSHCNGGNIET